MELTNDIENYIYFLKEQFGLNISLHPRFTNAALSGTLTMFGLHCNDYCMCMKTNGELWKTCIAKQQKVYEKAKNGSFFGMCHAGVFEYVYPYMMQDEESGFISVSGYRIDNEKSRIARHKICERFGFSEEIVQTSYLTLKDNIPPKGTIDTLLQPLCRMLELLCLQSKVLCPDDENNFYNGLLHYINLYHNSKITLNDLCLRFHCSRSTISHTFKANNGLGISDYINKLRLDDAKALLRNTRQSITAISYSVGFGDANYFSNVFKRKFGLSPLQYRKQYRNQNL